MPRPVVGEVVGTGCSWVFGTINEVHRDHVVITFTDGKTEHYYFWDEVRWRVGPVNNWAVFEDFCHQLSPLERLAMET